MSGKFFSDLAVKNIGRNRRSYLPYALSCAGTAMMLYIMHALAYTTTLQGIYGGRTIQRTLHFGVVIMVLFAVLFMFYTHGFLIKRRKKEFALFNILGMEKRHLGRVLAVETLLVGTVSTAAGILLGALLSKLMYLIVLRMLGGQQVQALALPGTTLPVTLGLFLGIHLLTLLNTLREIHLGDPSSLLRSARAGEKPPRARVWLALLGGACLAAGYLLSLTSPGGMNAVPTFLLAVALVILGTYGTMAAGSVALLMALRRNQRFYYQPRHFSVVAGMIHRMKRNAAGLATICILSTMVLVMVSATLSMYLGGSTNAQAALLGRDARLKVSPVDEDSIAAFQAIVAEEAQRAGGTVERPFGYRTLSLYARGEEGAAAYNPPQIDPLSGLPRGAHTNLYLVPVADYNAATGQALRLGAGEMVSYGREGVTLPPQVTLTGVPMRNMSTLATVDPLEDRRIGHHSFHTLVMNLDDLLRIQAAFAGSGAVTNADEEIGYTYALDTGAMGSEDAQQFLNAVQTRFAQQVITRRDQHASTSAVHIVWAQAEFRAFYGGLLFVVTYLGLVFLMAMVLVIYYKQVSEGYEDQHSYAIMQRVGMSEGEVKQSVRRQVLLVFFLPLALAGLHTAMAFNILQKVLELSNLAADRGALQALVTVCTFLVFALLYAGVYLKTAGTYYRIVRRQA